MPATCQSTEDKTITEIVKQSQSTSDNQSYDAVANRPSWWRLHDRHVTRPLWPSSWCKLSVTIAGSSEHTAWTQKHKQKIIFYPIYCVKYYCMQI